MTRSKKIVETVYATDGDGVDYCIPEDSILNFRKLPVEFADLLTKKYGFLPALQVHSLSTGDSFYVWNGHKYTMLEIYSILDRFKGMFANQDRRLWLEERGLLHYGFLAAYGDQDTTYHTTPKVVVRKTRGGKRIKRARLAAAVRKKVDFSDLAYEGKHIQLYVGEKFREQAAAKYVRADLEQQRLVKTIQSRLADRRKKFFKNLPKDGATAASELHATHEEVESVRRQALADYMRRYGIRKASNLPIARAVVRRLRKWEIVHKLGTRFSLKYVENLTEKMPTYASIMNVSVSIILSLLKEALPYVRYTIPNGLLKELQRRFPNGWVDGIAHDKKLVAILSYLTTDKSTGKRIKRALEEAFNATMRPAIREQFEGHRVPYSYVLSSVSEMLDHAEPQPAQSSKRSTGEGSVSKRQADAGRLLLLLAGIEPNPGPVQNLVKDALTRGTKTFLDRHKSKAVKGKGRARALKQAACVSQAVQDANAKLAGANDALKEKLKDLQEEVHDKEVEWASVQEQTAKQLMTLTETVRLARERGYLDVEDSDPMVVFGFRGLYKPNMESSFEETDPVVTVNVMADGTWWTNAFGEFKCVDITKEQLLVAASTVSCTSKQRRCANIYNGLIQAKCIKDKLDRLSYEDRLTYSMTLDKRAFLLTGCIVGAGRTRWLNDVPELVPHFYTVPAPVDGEERLRRKVVWSYNCLKFEASHFRKFRAAPIRVQGETPYVPDATDHDTMVAAFCKRLFPDLPVRSQATLRDLSGLARTLGNHIATHAPLSNYVQDVPPPLFADAVGDDERADEHNPEAPFETYEDLRDSIFEKALKGRPQYEVSGIRAGYDMAREDPDEAIEYYLSKPYKCFIKLECYPKGSLKPPRFIMSMDLECRGIQVFFMGVILMRVEVGTREGNVKGLTEEQRTARLVEKFSDCLVGETDFSSFESCIGPDLKRAVENSIFRRLASTPFEEQFIGRCLDRLTVTVVGPFFTLPDFHHIRMSGDYWTSLGNLIENVVVMSYCLEMDPAELLRVGLFEGDDGVFPAPADPERVLARSLQAGVKLTFDIAPWRSLSFCGNHFEDIDGEPLRFRDKYKALANLCTLYNAPGYSKRHDLMLQRSKALAYLSGPIIPDVFVVAAVIERYTRLHKVDSSKLERMGLLKEYSSYGVEGCVPEYLYRRKDGRSVDDNKFIKVVIKRNKAAGGECSKEKLREMIDCFKDVDLGCSDVVLPCPYACGGDMSWYYRDGTRFTHSDSVLRVPIRVYNDVTGQDNFRRVVPPWYKEYWTRKNRAPVERENLWWFYFKSLLRVVAVLGLIALVIFGACWYLRPEPVHERSAPSYRSSRKAPRARSLPQLTVSDFEVPVFRCDGGVCHMEEPDCVDCLVPSVIERERREAARHSARSYDDDLESLSVKDELKFLGKLLIRKIAKLAARGWNYISPYWTWIEAWFWKILMIFKPAYDYVCAFGYGVYWWTCFLADFTIMFWHEAMKWFAYFLRYGVNNPREFFYDYVMWYYRIVVEWLEIVLA